MICENCMECIGELVPLRDKAKREEYEAKNMVALEVEKGIYDSEMGFLCYRCYKATPEERKRLCTDAIEKAVGKLERNPMREFVGVFLVILVALALGLVLLASYFL